MLCLSPRALFFLYNRPTSSGPEWPDWTPLWKKEKLQAWHRLLWSPKDHIPCTRVQILKLVIIFFSVFLFYFSGLNFLSPVVLFRPGNVSSLKPPTRGEYICDTTDKCGLSVLGHQLSHCLVTAGFPQASQGFTEVSTQSLDQNKQNFIRLLTFMNRNSARLGHTETLMFSYLS